MTTTTNTISARRFNEISQAISEAGLKTGYARGYQETVLASLLNAERRAYEAKCKQMDRKDAARSDSSWTY